MIRVLSVIPAPTYGGAANMLVNLREPLARRGIEAIAVLPNEPGNAAGRLEAGGIEVIRIAMPRLRASAAPHHHLALLRDSAPAVRSLRAIVRERGAHIVQNNGDVNPHAAIAGRLERVAVVWQIQDSRTPLPLRLLTGPPLVRMSDSVMSMGRALGLLYPGVSRLGPRHVVVFPPVDTRRFRRSAAARSAARAELGIPADAVVVGTVGNRNPQKGQSWLVRAAAVARAGHPEMRLVMLGAQSPGHSGYERELVQEIERHGLDGVTQLVDPGSRVPELIQALDVMVISSVPRSEGIPTAILEAQACGIPVVSTAVGAVPEFLEDGVTGLVTAPLDAAALGGAIQRLLDDAELRERIARGGHERLVARYGLEACADRVAEVYEVALAHHRSRTGQPASSA